MMVLVRAVWIGVGCGLGRVEVVAFGCDGTSVACALLVVGWVPLGVLSLASGCRTRRLSSQLFPTCRRGTFGGSGC